jgi:catechol 2,3-dioxygenase-like lactoylglutathione lyase family enzyme
MRLVFLLFACAATVAAAADIGAQRGLQEIVLSVKNLEQATDVYRTVGKFVVKADGPADPALVTFWGLPAGTRVHERVMGVPSTDKGFLRLVRIEGLPQVQIRSSARPFDTGGIFNFNALVKDMPGVFEALRDVGFQGFADPNYYTIFGKKYGGAMLRGHDGVVTNLLERVDQPWDDIPPFATMSHIINATQMVKDYEESRDFFVRKLGWHVRWEAAPNWPSDGSNNMGIPNNLLISGAVKERAASFLFAKDADGGSIEIFKFDGVTGKDFADRAHPPNLGVLSYRIHVPDLTAYAGTIASRGVEPRVPLTELTVAPYGKVRQMVVVAPSGAWLEFFETVKAP